MKAPITTVYKKMYYDVLETVKDPEIDTVSIIDLGMVEKVTIQ